MKQKQKGEVRFFSKQIHSREQEIQRLRRHIHDIEGSEKRVSLELENQLSDKEEQIQKLVELLNAREDTNRKLSRQLDSTIKTEQEYAEKIKEAISRKENTHRGIVNKLTVEIGRKDKQIAKLQQQLVASQKELPREKDNTEELLKQIAIKGKDSDQSRAFYEKRERVLKHQLALLENEVTAERERVDKLKASLIKKDREASRVIRIARMGLSPKDREFQSLQNKILRREHKLAELEKTYSESEKHNQTTIKQLHNELLHYRKQIEELEALLDDKELIRNRLERNFRQQMRNKDNEINRLANELKHQSTKRLMAQERQELARINVKLRVKEEEADEANEKLQNAGREIQLLRNRLEERQKLFVESEESYTTLIKTLQQQHEERIKEVMRKATEREIALRSEMEKMKAEQKEQALVLAEKQKQIDDVITQFGETTKRMMALKKPATEQTHEEYFKNKEEEIDKLLEEATRKINDALKKEDEIAQREATLEKQQRILENELAMLESSGMDPIKIKEYMEGKEKAPAPIPPEPAEKPVAQRKVPVFDIDKRDEALNILRTEPSHDVIAETLDTSVVRAKAYIKQKQKERKGTFKEAKSKAKILPKPVLQKKLARHEERDKRDMKAVSLFPDTEGYSEVEEILSVINIGLQHGDSKEEIRKSLLSSGYSEKSVEKAFSQSNASQ